MILKYRAWYVLAEEMINEILMISFVRKEIIGKFSDGSTSVPLKFEDKRNGEDVILMQSTGLKDKNGKEIFEFDVVSLPQFGDLKPWVGVVKRMEGKWVVDTGELSLTLWSEIEETDILGNIFENPELLEATE